MALDGIADAGAALAHFVLQVTRWALSWIVAPLRFLFSTHYRREKCQRWRATPWLGLVEIPGSLLLLAVSGGVFYFWGLGIAGMIDDHRHPEKVQRREAAWSAAKKRFSLEALRVLREKKGTPDAPTP